MKKILRVFKQGLIGAFIISMFGGCAVANLMANIKPESSVITFTSDINNPEGIIGEGEVFYKNIDTSEESSFLLHPSQVSYKVEKLKPGNYIISKWIYNACRWIDKNNVCKSKHDFKGSSSKLINNSFSITKGETLYLGRFVVDSTSKSLTLIDNSSEDINMLKNHYTSLKPRKIQNISNKLEVENWKFNITGRKIFGF